MSDHLYNWAHFLPEDTTQVHPPAVGSQYSAAAPVRACDGVLHCPRTPTISASIQLPNRRAPERAYLCEDCYRLAQDDGIVDLMGTYRPQGGPTKTIPLDWTSSEVEDWILEQGMRDEGFTVEELDSETGLRTARIRRVANKWVDEGLLEIVDGGRYRVPDEED